MGKAIAIMGAIIFVLLIVVSIQTPKLSAADDARSDASSLGTETKKLLRALDVRCTARDSDTQGIIECIRPVLLKNDFESDEFKPFNEARNTTGVFIIRNDGPRTYNGSAFTMTKNGEVVHTGCHISGQILQDYTCRFDLAEPCRAGDVFEISYGESRLVTRTC